MSLYQELTELINSLITNKDQIALNEKELERSQPPEITQDSLTELEYNNVLQKFKIYKRQVEELNSKGTELINAYNNDLSKLLSKIELDNKWLTLSPKLRIKKSSSTIEVFKGDQTNFIDWQNNNNSESKKSGLDFSTYSKI